MQIGHSSSSSRGRLSKESDTDVAEALPPLSEAGGFVDQTGRVFIAGGRLAEPAPWRNPRFRVERVRRGGVQRTFLRAACAALHSALCPAFHACLRQALPLSQNHARRQPPQRSSLASEALVPHQPQT